MSRNYMSKNDELRRGDYLLSNNEVWKAAFQDDGNFVVYKRRWEPVWASNTWRSDGFRVCLQSDCNLVMYKECDTPIWSTETSRLPGNMCHLRMTDEGKLELYREAEKIWSSECPVQKTDDEMAPQQDQAVRN